jgi:hypothetical protein
MTHMGKKHEFLPCFLEETTSYVFEQVCALGNVVLPEVID